MRQVLRDYQAEDVQKILAEFESVRSTLYVAATGLGKTRVMVELAERFVPGRTLFLAHRSELISQAVEAFQRSGLDCEIEKAELSASTNLFNRSSVVVASVQTLLSGNADWTRMRRFNPNDFALLLYDESHHSVSPGNKRIVDYFLNGNPKMKCCGVSATPDRADEQALGQIFESVASERGILWGKDNGWLVDIEQLFVPVAGLDYSHIRTTAGDLNGADLAAVMEAEEVVQKVVQPTLEKLFNLQERALDSLHPNQWGELFRDRPRRRAIVFTCSVRHAEMLSDIFNRALPGLSAWVEGKTRDDHRKLIFDGFKNGSTGILVNCGVTTEGYDNPFVDMIVMARPTKSRSLYAQCIGRGTRPLPGIVDGLDAKERIAAIAFSKKPAVLVLDFVGNSGKHKLITTGDLLGDDVSEEAVERAVRKAKEEGKPVRMGELIDKTEDEIEAEREERKRLEQARKAKLVLKARYTTHSVNPFDVLQLQPVRERGWDAGKTLSEKQRALLNKQGIDPDSMPYSQSKAILNELFSRWNRKLCTFKQAKLLQKHGFDPKDISMKEATSIIDQIAANHWRVTDEQRNAFLERRKCIAKEPQHEEVPF